MKKYLILLFCLGLWGCATVITSSTYVKESDLQKVAPGDSFDMVTARLGKPNQYLPEKTAPGGKKQNIWLYDIIPHEQCRSGFFDVACPNAADQDQDYEMQLAAKPPYLVIFTDGKVSGIERQKIDKPAIKKKHNKKEKGKGLFSPKNKTAGSSG